jgi:hypothetical protein
MFQQMCSTLASDLEVQQNTEIEEKSTSLFYEHPSDLQSLMDASFYGRKGPLIPVVHVQPVVSQVKLKERPCTWIFFHTWLKNTKLVYSLPRNNNKNVSHNKHGTYREFIPNQRKHGTNLCLMPYQRFMQQQAFC